MHRRCATAWPTIGENQQLIAGTHRFFGLRANAIQRLLQTGFVIEIQIDIAVRRGKPWQREQLMQLALR